MSKKKLPPEVQKVVETFTLYGIGLGQVTLKTKDGASYDLTEAIKADMQKRGKPQPKGRPVKR